MLAPARCRYVARHRLHPSLHDPSIDASNLQRTHPDASAPGNCENCSALLQGAFCHECGQRARAPLRSVRSFLREAAGAVFDLDSRVLRSVGALLVRPGHLTAEYLRGRRVRYTQPLQIYFAAVTLFFLVNAYRPFVSFDVERRSVVSSLSAAQVGGSVSREKVAELAARGISLEVYRERFEAAVTGYLPSFLIGSVLLFALALALSFWRHRRPALVHLVFAVHWTAFFLILMIVERFLPQPAPHRAAQGPPLTGILLAIAGLVYLVIALRRVYGQGWVATALKGAGLMVAFYGFLIVWMLSVLTLAFTLL